MKKYLPMIVLFGLIAFSCQKVNNPQTEPAKPGYYTFTLKASADDPEITKTDYAADQVTFSWSTNDEISVLFHNGETHKFFTLKTSQGGSKTATFSGQVEEGYELGASETEGGAYWALFPANSAHSWNTSYHMPDFNFAAETDYTQSHFSANIPMWGSGDADGSFTFRYLTGCYKFTFTDIESSKIKLTVHNNGNGYYLSGKSSVMGSGSDTYLDCYNNRYGAGSKDVSFIEAVDATSKTAVFYVPYRSWDALKPNLTLTDPDTGTIIAEYTAKASLQSVSLGKLVVIPAKSLAGITPFVPKINIDGNFDDWDGITEFSNDNPAGSSSANRIAAWRATSDEQYIYLYYVIGSGKITSANYSYIYTGFDIGNDGVGEYTVGENVGGPCDVELLLYPFVLGSSPVACTSSATGHIKFGGSTVGSVNVNGKIDGNAYIEASIPRDKIGSPATGVVIKANHSYQGYTTGWHTFTLE